MNKTLRNTILLILLISSLLVTIYRKQIKDIFFKESFFLVFDVNKNQEASVSGYPLKLISKEKNNTKYFIWTDDNTSIELVTQNMVNIEWKDIQKFNIISVDSFVQILPGFEYVQLGYGKNEIKKVKSPEFYILEIDSINKLVKKLKVQPKLNLYD